MTERTDKQNALDIIKYLTDMLIADEVIIRNDLAENIITRTENGKIWKPSFAF